MADGGVVESALLSAAIGGGTSAIMGGDPLKGALMGGLTGGAMGFINPSSAITTGLTTEAQSELANNLAQMQMNGATDAQIADVMGRYGYTPDQISQYQTSNAYTLPGAGSVTMANPAAKSNLLGIGNLSNAQLGMAAGSAGIGALLGSKPNYMERFQPKTAAQLGMPTATLAANYQPWRPRYYAAGGEVPALQVGPGSVATKGVAPYSLNPQPEQNQGITMSDLQGLAQQYGYSIPGMAIGGLAMGGQPNQMYPQSQQEHTNFATPTQMPTSAQTVMSDYDTLTSPFTGQEKPMGMASGGIADLGGYSDGGRMLRGPGDGMSDSIPASISGRQPARLADGEFVVPADVVSHLGNGSTDAGAKQLYKMMDKVRTARTGRKSQGKQINPKKYVPA